MPIPAERRCRSTPGDTTRRPRHAARCWRPALAASPVHNSAKAMSFAQPGDARRTGSARRGGRTPARRSRLGPGADQVHAVVPVAGAHERQPVLAELQPVSDRTNAMLIQRGGLLRASRQIVIAIFVRLDRPARRGKEPVRQARRYRQSSERIARWPAAATGNRPKCVCGRRDPAAGATSAGRRLPRNWWAAQRKRCSRISRGSACTRAITSWS